MEVPILRIPGITRKAMLLGVFTCNCEGREMFPPPINSNNDSLDILELLLKTSKQNSFHELSQKQEIDKSAYYKYNCDCIL